VAAFLGSRGGAVPDGSPADGPGAWTAFGLAARQSELFEKLLSINPVRAFPGTSDLLGRLKAGRIPVVLATSARNADGGIGAVRAEAAGVGRRVAVSPVEVLRIAHEVAPIACGRAPAELVHLRAEPLDEPDLEAARRPRLGVRRSQPAALSGPPERVPNHCPSPEWPRPQAKARQT